jgi:hypothetical protein
MYASVSEGVRKISTEIGSEKRKLEGALKAAMMNQKLYE